MKRWALSFACAAGCLLTLDAAQIRAQLSADEVAGGEGALLSLTIEGGKPERPPQVPQVEHLVVNARNQSMQTQIINGKVSSSYVYTYVIGSYELGEYEIPAIEVVVNGEKLSTQPLKLKVRGGAAGQAQGEDADKQGAEDPKRYGYLTFELVNKERSYVYPGEIAPVRIRAHFPLDAAVSLKSLPRPEGAAFTLHHLSSEPEQTREAIDGKGYLVVTWYGGLSATKAGKYPARLTIAGTVSVRDRKARARTNDPFFGGSMFDDLFPQMIPKEVTLTTAEDSELEVRELPAEGRPADFAGAIGQFQFQRVTTPNALKTGEPSAIEAEIRGTGNFALLKEPQPQPPNEWKVYHGSDEFTPADVASFSGSKNFRFNVVPLAPGEKQLALAFSYFDPDAGQYRTVSSEPRLVAISGASMMPSAAASAVVASPPQTPLTPTGPQLAPLRGALGAVGDYRSWAAAPWFLPALIASGALTFGIAGFAAWRRRYDEPAKRRQRAADAALRAALDAAARAEQAGDAGAFFHAARAVLRLRIAYERGALPEAMTLADVSAAAPAEAAEILREADRWDYSGAATGGADLAAWHRKLLAASRPAVAAA